MMSPTACTFADTAVEERLRVGIADVCGLINAAQADLVRLVAEVLDTGAWQAPGICSVEHWVAWQCGTSRATARRLVRLARRHGELPVTMERFAQGRLSVDQVDVVARHAPTERDAEIAQFAEHATVSQLTRTLRRYQFHEPPQDRPGDPEPEPPVDETRTVAFGTTDDGRWRMHVDLPLDQGAQIQAALRAARDLLWNRAGDPAARLAVTWADALTHLVASAVPDTAPWPERDRYRCHLHLETGPTGLNSRLHLGPALPDALRRLLCCDTSVTPIFEQLGIPVGVGRTTRIVPDRLRRTVEHRDGGCAVPGCDTHHVEIHHIRHWEDGGPTDTANLLALCRRHHRHHHLGLLHIHGNPDTNTTVFADRHGRPIAHHPPPLNDTPPRDTCRRIGITPGHWQHPTGERFNPHDAHFGPPIPRRDTISRT